MVETPFSRRLREIKDERGTTVRAIAARARYSKSYIHDLLNGGRVPSADVARGLDIALGAGGELIALAALAAAQDQLADDRLDALELARRVEASDIGGDTIALLHEAFDGLAVAYAKKPPVELLPRIRHHLAYVAKLMDARATLQQRQDLITIGGWLSLLAATVHIDMNNQPAAHARLRTAGQLAAHAEHDEIRAWCLETRAWEVLTTGDCLTAIDLSRQAQAIAPAGSSAQIQATAQEGRAWARMGARTEARATLERVQQLVDGMPRPDQPEHHYRYDPDKARSYAATTLAWAGDPAAEGYARSVIAHLEADGARPRRVASARLDLGLALLSTGQPDEAAHEAIAALASGRIVPSNWWRATEVLRGVERAGVGEAADLREVYEEYRPIR